MPNKLQLLAVPLALTVFLLGVTTAQATPIDPTAAPLAFEEELEFEEEGEEEGAELEEGSCEEAEEEFEEGELSGAEVKEICAEAKAREKKGTGGTGSIAPKECILRSAHAHAAIGADGKKLKLTISYTTYEPVASTIEVGKGSNHIATLHRHLGDSGILRIVEGLHGHDAPKRLTVGIDIPSAGKAGCPSRRLVLFPH
ncbi:MAG TPA: hypothetical protein VKC63_06535 [Solirubrobacterales bacterium]|nr:hypothetical protein [Solirubrobacterales bacterium]